MVCKSTYEANKKGNVGWNKDFFNQIGLEDLLHNNSNKIGELFVLQVYRGKCCQGWSKLLGMFLKLEYVIIENCFQS